MSMQEPQNSARNIHWPLNWDLDKGWVEETPKHLFSPVITRFIVCISPLTNCWGGISGQLCQGSLFRRKEV